MISASLVKELRELSGAGMMDCKKALEATEGQIEAAMDWLREKGIAKASKKEARIAAEGLANIYIEEDKAVMLEVNSETDFVSKNEEFTKLIDEIGEAILKGKETDLDKINELPTSAGTVNDLIVAKTNKIGEKLALRRVLVINKKTDENFGTYLHMGGKIAVLTVLKGANPEIAKEVAMQVAAMKPQYLKQVDVPQEEIDKERVVLKEQAINEGKDETVAEKMVEGRLNKYFKEICLTLQPFIKDGDLTVEKYVTNNGGEIISMYRYEVGEGMQKRTDNFAEEVMTQIKE